MSEPPTAGDDGGARGLGLLGVGAGLGATASGDGGPASGRRAKAKDDGDGEGTPGGDGRMARIRELAPVAGGIAAVTVLIAGLAIAGTDLARKESGTNRPVDSALGEAAGPAPDDGAGDEGARSDDDRPSTTTTTTTTERATTTTTARDEPTTTTTAGTVRPSATGGVTGGATPASTGTTAPPDPGSPLVYWQVGWTPASTDGVLRVTIGSPGGSDRGDDVVVTISLTGGVRLSGGLDGSCTVQAGDTAGHVDRIGCTVPAPTDGTRTVLSIGLAPETTGEQATVTVEQGNAGLGTQGVALTVPEPSTSG
ncbi:MAG TPA: hypothetical protein VF743_01115 [Acidimicrobiales bacterium]